MTLLSAFRDTEYVCLTGFNLAMVIQMLQYDGDDLHELAEDIASIGKRRQYSPDSQNYSGGGAK